MFIFKVQQLVRIFVNVACCFLFLACGANEVQIEESSLAQTQELALAIYSDVVDFPEYCTDADKELFPTLNSASPSDIRSLKTMLSESVQSQGSKPKLDLTPSCRNAIGDSLRFIPKWACGRDQIHYDFDTSAMNERALPYFFWSHRTLFKDESGRIYALLFVLHRQFRPQVPAVRREEFDSISDPSVTFNLKLKVSLDSRHITLSSVTLKGKTWHHDLMIEMQQKIDQFGPNWLTVTGLSQPLVRFLETTAFFSAQLEPLELASGGVETVTTNCAELLASPRAVQPPLFDSAMLRGEEVVVPVVVCDANRSNQTAPRTVAVFPNELWLPPEVLERHQSGSMRFKFEIHNNSSSTLNVQDLFQDLPTLELNQDPLWIKGWYSPGSTMQSGLQQIPSSSSGIYQVVMLPNAFTAMKDANIRKQILTTKKYKAIALLMLRSEARLSGDHDGLFVFRFP